MRGFDTPILFNSHLEQAKVFHAKAGRLARFRMEALEVWIKRRKQGEERVDFFN